MLDCFVIYNFQHVTFINGYCTTTPIPESILIVFAVTFLCLCNWLLENIQLALKEEGGEVEEKQKESPGICISQ